MKKDFGDFTVEFDDSQETKNKVFDALINWYCKVQAFTGESIMQSDDPQIEAAPFLSDLADDVIKFDITYKDDI